MAKFGSVARPVGRSHNQKLKKPRSERRIGIMPTGLPLSTASDSIETLSAVTKISSL